MGRRIEDVENELNEISYQRCLVERRLVAERETPFSEEDIPLYLHELAQQENVLIHELRGAEIQGYKDLGVKRALYGPW